MMVTIMHWVERYLELMEQQNQCLERIAAVLERAEKEFRDI